MINNKPTLLQGALAIRAAERRLEERRIHQMKLKPYVEALRPTMSHEQLSWNAKIDAKKAQRNTINSKE